MRAIAARRATEEVLPDQVAGTVKEALQRQRTFVARISAMPLAKIHVLEGQYDSDRLGVLALSLCL
jgi:hypothetical protein